MPEMKDAVTGEITFVSTRIRDKFTFADFIDPQIVYTAERYNSLPRLLPLSDLELEWENMAPERLT
jgi:hypothetical protein